VQKDDTKLSARARVRTDADGKFWVVGAVPAAYPIPNDGPVGQMLNAQGRHPFRAAHVHFMVAAPGYQMLVTYLFLAGSEYLDSDVVFGVKDSLIEVLGIAEPGMTSYGASVQKSMPVLRRDFVLGRTLDG
jgi:hydroxyquinol 1,2-dioxygenase